jgi:hypothetical protein
MACLASSPTTGHLPKLPPAFLDQAKYPAIGQAVLGKLHRPVKGAIFAPAFTIVTLIASSRPLSCQAECHHWLDEGGFSGSRVPS